MVGGSRKATLPVPRSVGRRDLRPVPDRPADELFQYFGFRTLRSGFLCGARREQSGGTAVRLSGAPAKTLGRERSRAVFHSHC